MVGREGEQVDGVVLGRHAEGRYGACCGEMERGEKGLDGVLRKGWREVLCGRAHGFLSWEAEELRTGGFEECYRTKTRWV